MHNLMQEDVKNYSCFVQRGRHVNHTHSPRRLVILAIPTILSYESSAKGKPACCLPIGHT